MSFGSLKPVKKIARKPLIFREIPKYRCKVGSLSPRGTVILAAAQFL